MDISDIKKQLIKAYNKDAPLRKERDRQERTGWKKNEVDNFINLLNLENKKSILELGSGIGIDALRLKKEGFDILATDLSPKMVDVCKSYGLNAQTLDLYELKELKQKFDSVFSMNVLLHVPRKDLNNILEGVISVLNTNGIFYCGVYGGKDIEKFINDQTRMGEDRFFSFLTRKSVLEILNHYFDLIDYHEVPQHENDKWFTYHSITLRKK